MPRRHSSWVNLQDYLGLNEAQGQEMGNRVYNDVESQAQQAGRAIGSAETRFGYGADAGTLRGPDENAFNTGSNLYTPGDARQKAASGYTGPQSLADVDAGLGKQVGDAVQRVQNAQSDKGLGQELQKTYAGQAATGTGGGALDSFLTGATSADKLSGLSSSYGGLMESLGLADRDAMKRAQEAQVKSKAAASRWGELVPVLEEEQRRQAEAAEAGRRAHEKLLYDIDEQQEQQYGRTANFGDHRSLQDSSHYEDPRLRAYKEGWGSQYDRDHPPDESTGKYQEGYKAYGDERKKALEGRRDRAGHFAQGG